MKKIVLVALMVTAGFSVHAKEEKGANSCPFRHKGGLFEKTKPSAPSSSKLVYDPANERNTAK